MTSPPPRPPAPKIGFVSLGCPKALVDSERIITKLRSEGYELSASYEGADAVVVNTCGFLNSAKEESLAAIGEALAENGRVIVTGCLGVEADRIRAAHPQVLAITGPHQYEAVVDEVHKAVPRPHDPFLDLVPPQGVRLTPRHYAYLKISEGCNNACSFCIIPALRGRLKSRGLSDVLGEAERLVAAGVQELLVISQDTSAYGLDLGYAASAWRGEDHEARFLSLAKALGSLGAWVRLHYVYPYPHVDQVVPLMAEGRVLPYLDIPFQHASPKVLKAMRRPAHQEKTLERIARWRDICPDLAIRSTFIVGFPGETEDDFALLLDWLSEARLVARGLLQIRECRRRRGQRAARPCARRGKGRALRPADAAPTGDQHRAARHAHRQDNRGPGRRGRRRLSSRAVSLGCARDRRECLSHRQYGHESGRPIEGHRRGQRRV